MFMRAVLKNTTKGKRMPLLLDTYCDICGEVRETRYIDLFVLGSEGTRLCHKCEMLVVEFIREKQRERQTEMIRKAKERNRK